LPFKVEFSTLVVNDETTLIATSSLAKGSASQMIMRTSKILLVAGIALLYSLVVFNNLTDFDSNYQFVKHVLAMDSTFPGNRGLWRAIPWPWAHLVSYLGIIAFEFVTAVLLWWGSLRLFGALTQSAAGFQRAKGIAVAGLTLGMVLFLAAFLAIGGEWFLMWQSHTWNGQEAAFRMFTVAGIVLLYLVQPESEAQP
jgi:predicted small integral membrane protein